MASKFINGRLKGACNGIKFLVISPVPIDAETAGNRARISNLITSLESLGHDVTFAYVPYESADYRAMERCLGRRLRILRSDGPPEYTLTSRAKRKILRALGLRSAHLWCVDDWFDNGLLSQVLRLQNTEGFDTVLNEYVFLSKLAAAFPESVRTIVDTHDLMGNRHKIYLDSGMQPAWFSTAVRREALYFGFWPNRACAASRYTVLIRSPSVLSRLFNLHRDG